MFSKSAFFTHKENFNKHMSEENHHFTLHRIRYFKMQKDCTGTDLTDSG
jgi:hypothetical protein